VSSSSSNEATDHVTHDADMSSNNNNANVDTTTDSIAATAPTETNPSTTHAVRDMQTDQTIDRV
jgi:hypothetical protein